MESIVTKSVKPESVPNIPPKLKLITLDLTEFLAKNYPPKTMLLAPWLPSKGLAMVHAPRGTGKTFFALSVALGVASGTSVLGWKPDRPKRVLYVDGEMSAGMNQERIGKLMAGMGLQSFPKDNLHILTLDDQKDFAGGLNLANTRHQNALEACLQGIDLVILDNLSCLYRDGDENSADSWDVMNDWLLQQRRAGRSVLMIHHSGKGGLQRGTSRREDILDTVLCLKPLTGEKAKAGASFKVVAEKCRAFSGSAMQDVETELINSGDCLIWKYRTKDLPTYEQVVDLYNHDFKQCEIASQLGINKSSVSKHLKNARKKGDVDG